MEDNEVEAWETGYLIYQIDLGHLYLKCYIFINQALENNQNNHLIIY